MSKHKRTYHISTKRPSRKQLYDIIDQQRYKILQLEAQVNVISDIPKRDDWLRQHDTYMNSTNKNNKSK